MGRPGETEEERRIRKEKESQRRKEKVAENDSSKNKDRHREKLRKSPSDENHVDKVRGHRDKAHKRSEWEREVKHSETKTDHKHGDINSDRKVKDTYIERKTVRKRDETEEQRAIRKNKERRERKLLETELQREKNKSDNNSVGRIKSSRHRKETEEERKIRKEKEKNKKRKEKEAKKSVAKSQGYLAQTKSRTLKEASTKHEYERQIGENIIAENKTLPTGSKPLIVEQYEIDEVYEDDFDNYEDDFEEFEPNPSNEKVKHGNYESSPDVEFNYASLQMAMKKEASSASLKIKERNNQRYPKISDIPNGEPSSSPEEDYPAYKYRAPVFRADMKRAREIKKLITLDQTHEVTFRQYQESEYLRFLNSLSKNGNFKCVAVGTDDILSSIDTQTDDVNVTDSWSQNLISSKTTELTSKEENFSLMPIESMAHLAEITEVLIEETYSSCPKTNKKLEFRDYVQTDDFQVEFDEEWKFMAIYDDTELSIVSREDEHVVFNGYAPDISTIIFSRNYVFMGTCYGSITKQNIYYHRDQLSSVCIDNSHTASIKFITLLDLNTFISCDILGGIRKMVISEDAIQVVQSKELDQEIFACSSSDKTVYICLYDRVLVISKNNIVNNLATINTQQPFVHLFWNGSLLVGSNDLQTELMNSGSYSKITTLDFPTMSTAIAEDDIFFLSTDHKIYYYNLATNEQNEVKTDYSPTDIYARQFDNGIVLMIKTPECIELLNRSAIT